MELGETHRRINPPLSNYGIMFCLAVAFALQIHLDPEVRHIRPMILKAWTWQGLFGSMWLHMDPIHAMESLATLWIFGRFVTRRLKPMTYFSMYLLTGLIAAVIHVSFDGRPAVGASGAIMGILGMHIILCHASFGMLEPYLILTWFVISLCFGIIGLGPAAHLAHVGGFIAGIVLACVLLVLGIDDATHAHPVIARFCQRLAERRVVTST